MSKNENYIINKNIEKLRRKEATNFLDLKEVKMITSKMKRDEYKKYLPYTESEKIILYNDKIPKIRLLEIITDTPLTHREIMGSLFGLNIASDTFGDIIINEGRYYVMVVDNIYELIEKEFHSVGNKIIKIKEASLEILENYQRQYEEIEVIVSSLRIDTVISRLLSINRNSIKDLINKKEIILNCDILSNNSYTLRDNDIFSVRRYGKYKYMGIVKSTKKDNYIIRLWKYV